MQPCECADRASGQGKKRSGQVGKARSRSTAQITPKCTHLDEAGKEWVLHASQLIEREGVPEVGERGSFSSSPGVAAIMQAGMSHDILGMFAVNARIQARWV